MPVLLIPHQLLRCISHVDVMEYNFQMERSFGCQYISVLNTSDDHELIEAGPALPCPVHHTPCIMRLLV